MKIVDFGTLPLARTHEAHTGSSPITAMAQSPTVSIPSAAHDALEKKRVAFSDYLVDALSAMNNQQLDVTRLERQLITEPDSVDIQDVTIAMAKARMSLNLAQTVLDRIVSGWNELSTTR
ncbi:MAG: flagellar hook-basal body complex protein FliE [Treponema sp.]|nr:flagellar hook-basal body complex protein FliE [Treponema sp.]